MGRSKDPILSVRLPDDLDARLANCAAKLDLTKNDIARHAIRAAVVAIEENNFQITLPLEMAVQKKPVASALRGGGLEKIRSLAGARGATAPQSAKGPDSHSIVIPGESQLDLERPARRVQVTEPKPAKK